MFVCSFKCVAIKHAMEAGFKAKFVTFFYRWLYAMFLCRKKCVAMTLRMWHGIETQEPAVLL